MPFRKLNNLIGWAVCFAACTVYLMTMEAGGSFWDCGEFISCATKVQIPHPPGAPLFVLLGRLFVYVLPTNPARAVNTLSALASGFTILFLFWTITHFARKCITDVPTIMLAGVVGALAFAFSDSFWFSAVESEVYGLSSFFTALTIWAALKWEDSNDDRWIVLVFFLIGLGAGVHELSILTIPTVVMIYYFRRWKATWMGGILAFLAACVVTGFVQIVVLQKTIFWGSDLDVFFVDHWGLPLFSGFATFFALIGAAILIPRKNLALWCLAFLLLGYSTYVTPMERSNAEPAIDMYKVDNPVNLSGYLGRDQYGDYPLIRGQQFTARPRRYVQDGNQYAYLNGKYEITGQNENPVYDAADKMWLPRIWDNSNDQSHADFYAEWLGIGKDSTGAYSRAPNQWDNLTWFLTYQLNWMYWRYFFWNFSGRQNDLEGFGNPRDGNIITGINPLDRIWLGDQKAIPESAHTGRNRLFALPLLLGMLGFLFQCRRKPGDWIVVGALFFFTGLAIVLYLNQPGNQPRERDYAFVGSYYAFSIWIGLGVCMAGRLARWFCLFVPILMAFQEWPDHDRGHKTLPLSIATDYLQSCAPNAILFTFGDNDTYPLWYAQEAMGVRPDIRVINTNLLGFDWCIDKLRRRVNDSDPIDPIWTQEQVAGERRDVIYATEDTGMTDLEKMMREAGDTYSSHLVSVPVDTALVRRNGTVDPGDAIETRLTFRIPHSALEKGDAVLLNIIAANHWKRPIYFTYPDEDLGFGGYLRQDGLTYRLVPVLNDPVHIAWMQDKLLNVFTFGNARRPGVYFDEENRHHLLTLRQACVNLASALLNAGHSSDAAKVLEKCDRNMDPGNMPYGMCSRYGNYHNRTSERFAALAYAAGDVELARKVSASLRLDCTQQITYYASLPSWRKPPGNSLEYEAQTAGDILKNLDSLQKKFDSGPQAGRLR